MNKISYLFFCFKFNKSLMTKWWHFFLKVSSFYQKSVIKSVIIAYYSRYFLFSNLLRATFVQLCTNILAVRHKCSTLYLMTLLMTVWWHFYPPMMTLWWHFLKKSVIASSPWFYWIFYKKNSNDDTFDTFFWNYFVHWKSF